MKTLFQTVIGSHAWNMNVAQSDTDYFVCYQISTKELLKGQTLLLRSKMSINEDVDIQESEVGLVVHQLIKNNLNYIVNTMSPIVKETSPEHEQLKAFFPELLSKELYFSFHGMAIHNLKLFHKWWGDDVPSHKYNKIARVLQMGVGLLNGEPEWFAPYRNATEQEVLSIIQQIDLAHEHSRLPEKCPIKDKLLDWLVDLRLKYI
jgi:predicted nucleotidyltransferase